MKYENETINLLSAMNQRLPDIMASPYDTAHD